jgi:hypothetical protein
MHTSFAIAFVASVLLASESRHCIQLGGLASRDDGGEQRHGENYDGAAYLSLFLYQ